MVLEKTEMQEEIVAAPDGAKYCPKCRVRLIASKLLILHESNYHIENYLCPLCETLLLSVAIPIGKT